LAKRLNASARAAADSQPEWPPFQYHHLGSMALVGARARLIRHPSRACTNLDA
jgi:hypothetical protein